MKRRTDVTIVLPILSPILGEELALAIIELRDVVKREPLTEYAAKLQAKEYLKCGNPIDAAEMQILRSWRAIKSDWYFNEIKKQSQQSRQSRSAMDVIQERHSYSNDAFGLPAIEHRH